MKKYNISVIPEDGIIHASEIIEALKWHLKKIRLESLIQP